MVIICDTRQKEGKHELKHNYFRKQGYDLQFLPLAVGDYMLPENDISVDTKKDLSEVAGNVFLGRNRFLKEVKRAEQLGIRLVFLIENGGGIRELEDVRFWQNKYGKVSGKDLEKRMRQLAMNYGVDFRFCTKQGAGKKILEILGGEDQ